MDLRKPRASLDFFFYIIGIEKVSRCRTAFRARSIVGCRRQNFAVVWL